MQFHVPCNLYTCININQRCTKGVLFELCGLEGKKARIRLLFRRCVPLVFSPKNPWREKKTTCHISLSYHGVKWAKPPPPSWQPLLFFRVPLGEPPSPPRGRKGNGMSFLNPTARCVEAGPRLDLWGCSWKCPPCPLTLANSLWSNSSSGTRYPESLGGNARGWTTSRPPRPPTRPFETQRFNEGEKRKGKKREKCKVQDRGKKSATQMFYWRRSPLL